MVIRRLWMWAAVLVHVAHGLVKLELGVQFKELTTPVQSSSIPVRYRMDIRPHALDSNSEIDGFRDLLIRGTENLNDSIVQTCQLMSDAHRQLGTHYDTIVLRAQLLRRKRLTNPLAFIGDILGWCCSIATKADLSVALENDGLIQDQLDTLFESFDTIANVTRQNTVKWVEFSKSIHSKFQEIDVELTRIINSKDLMYDWFTHVTLRGVSSLTEMIVKLLMAEKLDQVYSACTQNQIPLSVLPPDMLQREMNILNDQLFPEAEIAISSVSALYKLSIVNCIFKEDVLDVIVKFPVKKRGSSWKMIDVVPLPFAYKKHVCKILPSPMMIITNDSHVRVLSTTQREDCLQGTICPLPRSTQFSPDLGACIEKLYFGQVNNFVDLRNNCKFICNPYSGPEIVDLDLNNFVVVHPQQGLTVRCDKEILPVSAVPIGSTKINIPCDCSLTHKNVVLIDRQFPCDPRLNNKFNKTIILPALWSKKYKKTGIQRFNFELMDLNVPSILTKNLSLVLPEFVVLPEKLVTERQRVSEVLLGSQFGVYAFCSILLVLQIVMFIWIMFLQKMNCTKNVKRVKLPKKPRRGARGVNNPAFDDNETELDTFRTRYAARI